MGDGTEVVAANIDLEMFNFMIQVMENYYPYGIQFSIGIGLPPVFLELMPEILGYGKGTIKDVLIFRNITDLPKFIDEKYILPHIKAMINNKSV